MKSLRAQLDGKLGGMARRRRKPKSEILSLDDDILLPADHHPVSRQVPPVLDEPINGSQISYDIARDEIQNLERIFRHASIEDSSFVRRIHTLTSDYGSVESDPDVLRKLLSAANDQKNDLERTIDAQTSKLSLYYNQILDLCNKRSQQADELQRERHLTESLKQSLTTLRDAKSKRDSELTATIQKLTSSEEERFALQAQLDVACRDYLELAERLLNVEKTLNDQHTAAATTREQFDSLYAELEQLNIQNAALLTELENTIRRASRERDEQQASLRSEIETITESSRQRSRQVENLTTDRAVLNQQREDLSRTVGLLEMERRKISLELKAKTGDLERLRTELSELKVSHASIKLILEHAETKFIEMRRLIDELESSRAILAEHNVALVEAEALNKKSQYQLQQELKSQAELVELLENQVKAARQGPPPHLVDVSDQLQFERAERIRAEQALEALRSKITRLIPEHAMPQHILLGEQGAKVIKLETMIRRKDVA